VAQQPTVSPRLAPALARDPTAPVWLFVRPGVPLDRITTWVTGAGGTVRRQSRWLHAVSAVLPPAALAAARGSRDLLRLQPVARFRRAPGPDPIPAPAFAAPPAAGPAQDSLYGPSAMPYRRLNLFPLADRGFRAGGITIAILDTGFETGLPPFARATVGAQYDFIFNDSIVRNQAADDPSASNHGTAVWSLLAADTVGTLLGIARDATFLLAKTEDVRSETPVEEDNFVAALEWADSLGADIVTSSLGYLTFDGGAGYTLPDLNGDLAVTTVAADLAAQRGILVLTAVGNGGAAGASTLITPSDGDSVLAVGAEDSTGVRATFSARGPTADGRVKPDFLAPGVAVWLAVPFGGGVTYSRGNGTSFATPLLAGAAALFLQVHGGADPMTVRSALRRWGSNRLAPDNFRGWGRPDVFAAVTFPGGVAFTSPGPTLGSVTPTFTWTAPAVPAFARPVRYRLRLFRNTNPTPFLDTTTTDTTLTLAAPEPAGTRLMWSLTATSADSIVATPPADSARTVPPWIVLATLDDPAGSTIREFRPEFRWTSPGVAIPPGPFVYDVTIIRADDGQIEIAEQDLTTPSFTPPADLERNTPYRWRVTARLDTLSQTVTSRGTFVIVDDTAPPVTTLFQNFPNPFPQPGLGQVATCLWFDLSVDGVVALTILDMRGLVVRRLIPLGGFGPVLPRGRYGRSPAGETGCDPRFAWDGTGEDGAAVPAGIYLARLRTPVGVFFKRIVYLGTP